MPFSAEGAGLCLALYYTMLSYTNMLYELGEV